VRIKKVWTIAVIAFLALAAAVPLVMRNEPAARAEQEGSGVRLLAVNVGKADSMLLWVDGKVYLIDTGTVQAWGALKTALDELQVTRLNGVFLTHTDKDHMGGMEQLAQSNIAVDAWYGSAMYTGVKPDKHPLPLAAAQRNKQPVWLKAGDTVSVTDTSSFKVLGPITLDEANENNNSLVMRLETLNGSILLTGDMELAEESALMAKGSFARSDVLKVSHHGEDDATSSSFVRLVSPQVAVISTNSVEEPDTPSPSVLFALNRAGVHVAVTQDAKGGMLVTLKDGKAFVEAVEWKNIPGISSAVRLAGLDAEEDVLTISNAGSGAVSLKGWYVFSARGEEAFFFPDSATLAPGATARIGSMDTPGACEWRFNDKNVWNNKKKDEAVLYDPYGRPVARIDNGLTEE
jgi:competence protein ComEC